MPHLLKFLESAAGNFVRSFAAGGLIFLLVQKYYELPKTKTEIRELLAVFYGLVKREIDAASGPART